MYIKKFVSHTKYCIYTAFQCRFRATNKFVIQSLHNSKTPIQAADQCVFWGLRAHNLHFNHCKKESQKITKSGQLACYFVYLVYATNYRNQIWRLWIWLSRGNWQKQPNSSNLVLKVQLRREIGKLDRCDFRDKMFLLPFESLLSLEWVLLFWNIYHKREINRLFVSFNQPTWE